MEENKTLLELAEQIPDDNSGSTASNRFGYQKNWPIYNPSIFLGFPETPACWG